MSASSAGYSFCETTTAPPLAPWHIRRVPTGEELRPGGGITSAALCGRELTGGWDIPNAPVTTERLATLAAGTPVGVCPRCAAALAQPGDAQQS